MVSAYTAGNPVRVFTKLPKPSENEFPTSTIQCCDLSRVSSVVPLAAKFPTRLVNKIRIKHVKLEDKSIGDESDSFFPKFHLTSMKRKHDEILGDGVSNEEVKGSKKPKHL